MLSGLCFQTACGLVDGFFAQKDDVGLHGFEVADLRQPPPFLEKGVEQVDAGVVVAEDDGDDVFDA